MTLDETPADRPSPPDVPRKRILFLTHRVPCPPDKGDRIRSYHVLEHLTRIGDVDLAFPADGPVDAPTRATLGRLCRRFAAVPIGRAGRWARAAWGLARGRSLTEGLFGSPSLGRLVGGWLDEVPYDAVVCFSSGVLPYLLGRGLEPRLVADLVDVDSQKWLDYAGRTAGPKAALFRLEALRVRALERAAGRCLAVVLATEAEAAIYRGFCPGARVEAIPNGVDLDYFRPSPDAGGDGACVFVGQLDYRANVLGLEWFCREVWPGIREALPAATFEVVGRNPAAAVRRLGSVPGVRVVGPVPDVRPYLAAARIVAVPLPVARGVQNKVLEAMAMGRAVVATPQAIQGLALVPGRDALAATDAAEWSRAVVSLWDDPARREELGRSARRYVEAHHRWETCLGRFEDLINVFSGARPTIGEV